jgi:hypothetical protein
MLNAFFHRQRWRLCTIRESEKCLLAKVDYCPKCFEGVQSHLSTQAISQIPDYAAEHHP